MTKKVTERWEYTVGVNPHRVTAFEDLTRGGVVTLRWHIGKTPHRKRKLGSLGFTVRGPRGGLDRDKVALAIQRADEHHVALVQGKNPVVVAEEPAAPLTIMQGWERAKDTDTGKWNKDTPYRRDIDRAMKRAVAIWGPRFTWDEVDRAALRKLWRRELERLRKAKRTGYRGAELTRDLVLAVGAWLRDEQLIASTAALRWKNMDDEFAADAGGEHEPFQPRYTLEEYRKLFVTSWQADERYGLLYDLGAEGRLGQFARAMRSQLNLDTGRLRIVGRSKKKGVIVKLTPQQLANVKRVLSSGYLAGLESALQSGEITDYPLFPGGHFAHDDDGRMVSRAEYATRAPIDRTAWRRWHREAERLADIPYIKGRGPYGSRRGGVDGAKKEKISREGLTSWGGWSDPQVPDTIYADQEMEYARDEASEVRARVRGESLHNVERLAPRELQESSQIVAPVSDALETTDTRPTEPTS